MALPGDLDSAFGGSFGRYFINATQGAPDAVSAIARQTDGKLLLVGSCGNTGQTLFCVARRNADGSTDSTFAAINGNTSGIQFIVVSAPGDEASSVVLEPDGRIVVAGTCTSFNIRSFCLMRLTQAGFTDPTFGAGNGRVNQIVGAGNARVSSLLRQPDGKYVVTGNCFDGDFNTLCAARFLPNGAFDMSFGNQGRRFFTVASDAFGFGAALQSDGKILVAGTCNAGASMCVGRLTAAGAVDTTFAQISPSVPTNGIAIASNGGNDVARSVAVQPDGKIVLAGRCPLNSQFAFCATRLSENGLADDRFGPLGSADRIVRFGLNASFAEANSVSLQDDGRMVLAGTCTNATNDFCMLRLNDNGAADQSFGSFGVVKTNVLDAADAGNASLIQPDGKIVVAGQCSDSSAPTDTAMCVARYEGGPLGARRCSFDIDGDGVVLGTTDLLILNRMAGGMQLRRAVNGVVFSANATRRNFGDIRTYLRTQCDLLIVD